MRLGYLGKMLVAVATLWLPAYTIYFMATVFATVMSHSNGIALGPDGFHQLFGLHMLTMLISLGMLAFYVVHIVKNRQLNDNHKIMWIVLLWAGSIVTMPVYFFAHIMPEPQLADVDGSSLS